MHASVKGMPVIDPRLSKDVAQHLVSFQGLIRTTKLKEKWEQQQLVAHHKPFRLKCLLHPLTVFIDPCANSCNTQPSVNSKQYAIESLSCPICDNDLETGRLALHRRQCFSNLTCKRCEITNSSRNWLCSCGVEWPKCPRHQPISKRPKLSHTSRKHMLKRKWGESKPLPQTPSMPYNVMKTSSSKRMKVSLEPTLPPVKRIRLATGSKLALKFPHLVQESIPIKGDALGVGMPANMQSTSSSAGNVTGCIM